MKLVCAQILGFFFHGRDARASFDVKIVNAEMAGLFFSGRKNEIPGKPHEKNHLPSTLPRKNNMPVLSPRSWQLAVADLAAVSTQLSSP